MEIFPSHLVESPVKSVKFHRVPDLENTAWGAFQAPGSQEFDNFNCGLMCKSSARCSAVVASAAAVDRHARFLAAKVTIWVHSFRTYEARGEGSFQIEYG